MDLVLQRRKVDSGYKWLIVDKDTDTVLPGQKNLSITTKTAGLDRVSVEFVIKDSCDVEGVYFDVHPSAKPNKEVNNV